MDSFATIVSSTLRLSTPIIFAAIGGLYCERSGVINIALEGIMLMSAFSAASTTFYFHDPFVGLLSGVITGGLISWGYAVLSIRFQANQIVTGTAINILAIGLPSVLCKALYGVTGSSPTIPINEKFNEITIPYLINLPILGEVFAKHLIMVYIAILIVLLTHFVLYNTTYGLRMRAVGEHPLAADTAGVNVVNIRYVSVVIGGMIASLGGVVLALGLSSSFSRNMTAGRGFIALAALILGKWKPIPVLFASLLFGLAEAMQIKLQGVKWLFFGEMPVQFIQMIPYIVTLIVLAGFIGKSQPPKSCGIPFNKEGV